MFNKFGQAFTISQENLISSESVLSDPNIENTFKKFATELKRIAPKANDFLYFSCSIISSAECSLLNPDGSTKVLPNGKKAEAHWDKTGGTYKWVANHPSLLPLKNSNGDIFPEEEILKAYRLWVGKPLCLDHKSSSVDFVRGLIVDTYYDRTTKKVIALCALDKVNYPDLARKVATGYCASVSMGTAVGRAVCTDCAAVARTEADFCQHMRTKSGYGEINLDLSPIELSIVVNGADPTAKIRHIIASADALNRYAETKETEFRALAESDSAKVSEIKEEIVQDIKKGLDRLIKEFEGAENDQSNADDYKDSITAQMPEALTSELGHRIASEESAELPVAADDSTASNDVVDNEELIKAFSGLKSSIEMKLSNIQQDFNRLLKLNDESRMNMSQMNKKEAYFQGGGGANEPAPKAVKYEKDPLNEKLREHGDKQMEGQMDTGPVDGMHPGYDSFGQSEIERKKMLARAEAEERSARRKTALSDAKAKVAYFQGTEEPKPGKVQYPVDPLNEKDRNKEDKQMQGQPPFPGVGSVDGLHPSPASADQKDELKRKEMLGRASLKAKFVKAAKSDGADDHGNSAWQVFANDKLVLSASVSELSGGRVDVMYPVIATRDFGTKMLEKVKEVGLEKAATLYKSSQAMPEMAAPAPAAPGADASEPSAPGGDPMPMEGASDAADKGGAGDPKENIQNMIEETKELVTQRLSDIKEGVDALDGEKEEMAPMAEAGKTASTLGRMRSELNTALTAELRANAESLESHKEELELISNLYESGNVTQENADYVGSLANDALAETRTTLAETMDIFGAFVKYARGTEAMQKRAELEATFKATANEMAQPDMNMGEGHENHEGNMEHLDHDDFNLDGLEELLKEEEANEGHGHDGHDANDATEMKKEDLAKLPAGTTLPTETKLASQTDLTTKEGRAAFRAKVAAETVKMSPMLDEAHKLVQDGTKLDVKPSGNLGDSMTIEEKHEAMLGVATTPVKIRQAAEDIMKLVKAGKLAPSDVEKLVAHSVDPAAIKYWKELWAADQDAKAFSAELVKDFASKKAAEEIEAHKVKLARAYELAYQMVEKGIVAHDSAVIAAQVDEVMKYNDEGFESLKRIVAKHSTKLTKEATRLPSVGLLTGEVEKETESNDMQESLNRAFSNRRY